MNAIPEYPRLGQALLLVLMLFLVQIGVGLGLGVWAALSGHSFALGDPRLVAALNALSFALILIYAAYRSRRPIADLFFLRRFPLVSLLPLALLLLGLGILLSEFDNLLRSVMPMPAFVAALFQNLTATGLASIIALSVVAPVTEELFFRAVILRGLLAQYGARKAIVVSAVIFALYHMNPYQFLSALTVGLIFGWLFVRTGSLWPCVLGHALHNLHALLIGALLPVNIPGYNSGDAVSSGTTVLQPLWFDLIGLAATVAGLAALRWTLRAPAAVRIARSDGTVAAGGATEG